MARAVARGRVRGESEKPSLSQGDRRASVKNAPMMTMRSSAVKVERDLQGA